MANNTQREPLKQTAAGTAVLPAYPPCDHARSKSSRKSGNHQ